jgi:hypothetical protein
MIPLDITLLDNFGITWVRQRCRCCGAVLWDVLGDRVGLCRRCHEMHSDPIGVLRIEHNAEHVHRFHTLQYHGVCAMDV